MKARDILAMLKGLGRPQVAAIYRRMGSDEDVCGVLTSRLAKLAKTLKVDAALSRELWDTRHADARILALLIADPARLTSAEADRMVRDDHAHFYWCYLSDLVARSRIASAKMRAWMRSPREFIIEAGYGVLSYRLKKSPDAIADAEAARILGVIERKIHAAPNFARYAMNDALISIGVHKPSLRAGALRAAKRIGPVEVDHGDTYCKTPVAADAIARILRRKRGR